MEMDNNDNQIIVRRIEIGSTTNWYLVSFGTA